MQGGRETKREIVRLGGGLGQCRERFKMTGGTQGSGTIGSQQLIEHFLFKHILHFNHVQTFNTYI
jgi:hypothetical protein